MKPRRARLSRNVRDAMYTARYTGSPRAFLCIFPQQRVVAFFFSVCVCVLEIRMGMFEVCRRVIEPNVVLEAGVKEVWWQCGDGRL